MITQITGKLIHLSEDAATVVVGAFHYEVFVPEFVRRQLQGSVGEDVTLRTMEYLEGNPQQGRLVPRMIGFTSDTERQFFDMVCSVDGVGVKKALRAMVRPVRDIAAAIEDQNVKELSTLPGVGPAVAERIVAKLRRKMARFALMVERDLPPEAQGERAVTNDAFEALITLGHTAHDAQELIDRALATGKKFKTVEDLLMVVYDQQRE